MSIQFIESGPKGQSRKIAMRGEHSGAPGLFWLGGFKSDMEGSKAQALSHMGAELGLRTTRFDYSGHGKSSGEFMEGTISDWLEDSIAVFGQTSGPQIIVGSSMGAWLALLLNQQFKDTDRVMALILIAPAVDMTKDLLLPDFSDSELKSLVQNGYASRPSDYDAPYIITKKLLDDGENHLIFGNPIQTNCPVHILQGGKDEPVPTAHALKLVSHLLQDPVFFTLVPDGDHSLSRPQDLVLLKKTILTVLAEEE